MTTLTNQSQDLKIKNIVLFEILEANEITLTEFARLLNIGWTTLHQYRTGKRTFRLNMSQIKILDQLLIKTGKRLSDLPPDWILDKT